MRGLRWVVQRLREDFTCWRGQAGKTEEGDLEWEAAGAAQQEDGSDVEWEEA